MAVAPVTMGEERLRVTLSGDVLFDSARHDLKPGAVEILGRVKASVIAAHPDARITVEGHTDSEGPADYNVSLSNRRSTSVATWLKQNGVAASQITEKGYGKAFPRASNDTPAGRAQNRRVELVFAWGDGGGSASAVAVPVRSCPMAQACCELAALTGKPGAEPGCIGKEPGPTGWGSDVAAHDLEAGDGVLRLNSCVSTRAAAVWITSTDEKKISRLDERTGKESFRVPTYGDFPQRTAVSPDGSVWVTNRDSYAYVHIAGDGKLLCSSPYQTCHTRAAAIDSRGFPWIGCFDTGDLIQVSPTETEGTTEVVGVDAVKRAAPKCKELGRVKTSVQPYGLVADRAGGLWTAASGGAPIVKIDSQKRAVVMVVKPEEDPLIVKDGAGCWSGYGVAIDRDGNPWYANMGCNNVVKLDGASGRVLGVFKGGPKGLKAPRALGVDREGHAWVAENAPGSTFVSELDNNGVFLRQVDVSSCGNEAPLGTSTDSHGDMWTAIQGAGKVIKYSTDGTILGCYPESPTPPFQNAYTYSDFTGAAMEIAGSDRGVARVRFENAQSVRWRLASWTGTTPAATNLCVRARSASSADKLGVAAWSAVTCPKTPTRATVNVSLDGTRGATKVPEGAALELEFSLSSSEAGASPLLSGLSVAATAAGR